MDKYLTALFLIMILVGVPSPNIPGIIDTGSSYSEYYISDPQITVETTDEYVIFFDNVTSYNKISSRLDISKTYENLLAIKTSSVMKDVLPESAKIVPASYYEKMELHFDQSVPTDYKSLLDSIPSLDGYDGSGITIAVMDNGVDFTHPSLSTKKVGSYFAGVSGQLPCQSHGTPVAGVAAGTPKDNFTGIATGAGIYDIQFSCVANSIEGDFLAAFDHAIAMNDTIDIINTSFGGFAPSWDPIIKQVVDSGIIVVGSAGNSGPSLHTTTSGGPGNSIHGISVGSVDENDEISLFSSRGPAHELIYKPDVLALGENVISTTPQGGFDTYSGTSFSSPTIAGAVAVLLSALKANNIEYNPGLIKTALMETAHSIGKEELVQGKGIVDLGAAYALIEENNLTNSGIVTLNPAAEIPHSLEYIPKGMDLQIPLSLISSQPDDVSISFSGDLDGVTTVSTIDTSYSQRLLLDVQTELLPAQTLISGKVIASSGTYNTTSNLSFKIGNPVVATLGIDLYHTYWDQIGANNIGGSNIGKMIQLALKHDIAVKEIDEPITDVILSGIDILWMPDPLNLLDAPPNPLEDQRFVEETLKQSEIDAIHNFVNSGNSLYVTTLGYRYELVGLNKYEFGLNTTGFNSLLTPYGITALEAPVANMVSAGIMSTRNQSSIVGSAPYLSYSGNYLDIEQPAWSIAASGSKVGVAIFQDPVSNGKVIVSSSNYWMDNSALSGGYGLKDANSVISNNLWNWFIQSDHPLKLSETISDTSISGTFSIPNSASNLNVYMKDISGQKTTISYEENNAVYSFDVPAEEEGRYQIFAEVTINNDQDYIGWDYIKDNTGPIWQTHEDNPNGTNFKDTAFIVLKFKITDDTSSIFEPSLITKLDGEEVDLVTNINDEELRVIIQTNQLTENQYHTLDLSITDMFDNPSTFHYQFGYELDVTSSSPKGPTSDTTKSTYYAFPMVIMVIVVVNWYISAKRRKVVS